MTSHSTTIAFELNQLTGVGLEHLCDKESGAVLISFFNGNECNEDGVIYGDDVLDLSE